MKAMNSDVMGIPEFYSSKSVFVTGSTGFIGKVLLEKLLRSCPNIGNIYILVRPKKGLDINARVKEMFKSQVSSAAVRCPVFSNLNRTSKTCYLF